TVVGTVAVGAGANNLAITPDGTRVYVSEFAGGTVAGIDASPGAAFVTIAPSGTLPSPPGLIQPGSSTATPGARARRPIAGGATVTIGGPLLDATSTFLTLAGAVLQIGGGSHFTSTAGPLVKLTGGGLTADSLVRLVGEGNVVHLAGTLLDATGATV